METLLETGTRLADAHSSRRGRSWLINALAAPEINKSNVGCLSLVHNLTKGIRCLSYPRLMHYSTTFWLTPSRHVLLHLASPPPPPPTTTHTPRHSHLLLIYPQQNKTYRERTACGSGRAPWRPSCTDDDYAASWRTALLSTALVLLSVLYPRHSFFLLYLCLAPQWEVSITGVIKGRGHCERARQG